MGKIVRMDGFGNRGRMRPGRSAHTVRPGLSRSMAISLSLVAAVGFVGAWGFLAAPDSTGRAAGLFGASTCHPSYAGRCLPIGRDLDCADVGGMVRVVGTDVYNLDADGDGEGCEPKPY